MSLIIQMDEDDKREILVVFCYDVERNVVELEFPEGVNSRDERMAILNKFIEFKQPMRDLTP